MQSLFGIEYVAPMTAAQVETEAVAVAKGSKESRARRWEVAKYLLRRAFRSGRLRTWCFDQTEQPLDSKYWSNPSSGGSWGWYLAFEYDPRGRPDVTRYLLNRENLSQWLRSLRQAPATRSSAGAERRCERWLSNLARAGELFQPLAGTQKIPAKADWRTVAKNQVWAKGLSDRAFERAWLRVAVSHPAMSARGRKPKLAIN